jgi:hypothetical protein
MAPENEQQNAKPEAKKPMSNYRKIGIGTGAVALALAIAGISYCARGRSEPQQPRNPYEKPLIVMSLTEEAKSALRNDDYRSSNLGFDTWHDANLNGKPDAGERYDIVLKDQDARATGDVLKVMKKLMDEGRRPVVKIERAGENPTRQVSSMSPVGESYPVIMVTREDGSNYWQVDPSFVSWVRSDEHPVDSTGTYRTLRHPAIRK